MVAPVGEKLAAKEGADESGAQLRIACGEDTALSDAKERVFSRAWP